MSLDFKVGWELNLLNLTGCVIVKVVLYFSLSCPSNFEGARGNLTRLFEKNKKRYIDVNQVSPRDLRPEQQRWDLHGLLFVVWLCFVEFDNLSGKHELGFITLMQFFLRTPISFSRSKDIKRFLVRFMHMLSLFMSDVQK